jgi:hypothetical protein
LPDAKRTARKQRLDLDQSVQRIQKLHSDFPRDEVEEFLLDWIDVGYDPENYSQAQLDELDELTEQWVADHLRKAKGPTYPSPAPKMFLRADSTATGTVLLSTASMRMHWHLFSPGWAQSDDANRPQFVGASPRNRCGSVRR